MDWQTNSRGNLATQWPGCGTCAGGLSLGEEQAAGEALARALATFSDDASMRARIATDARLLCRTQD
jgi:hypothetical protein